MKLDKNFRDILQQKLTDHKVSFLENNYKVAEEIINNEYCLLLDDTSYVDCPPHFDLEKCKQVLKTSINSDENLKLTLRSDDSNNYIRNEIKFIVLNDYKLFFNSPEERVHRRFRENMEYECEENFWKDSNNLQRYNEISQFNPFVDITVDTVNFEVHRHLVKPYNLEGWKEYLINLINVHFSEFKLNTSVSNGFLRFSKLLNKDIYLGFEFDLKTFMARIKKGDLAFPDYFNIILFTSNLKKKIKYTDYVHNYNDNILSLGILGNPVFYPPCFPISTFKSIEMYYDKNVPFNNEPKYLPFYKHYHDGTSKIFFSQDYGEKLKRHAFFYMRLLSYSSSVYLEYLEKSILETIEEY